MAVKMFKSTIGLDTDGDITFTSRATSVTGVYDAAKTHQIWSIGSNPSTGLSYKSDSHGSHFGNLYGLAYKHTTNTTGGTMAASHQVVWCINGTATCAMGDNLWTSGNVNAGGSAYHSDIRLKENILSLEPNHIIVDWKSFNTKRNPDDYRTGVIAQELEVHHPEFVVTDDDGMKSVKYIDLLIAKIAELEHTVTQLSGLQTRIESLESGSNN